MSVLKVETDIITNISARPIGLTEILTIMFVSTFKIAVILYITQIYRSFRKNVIITDKCYMT
jgi:hypothetical protein